MEFVQDMLAVRRENFPREGGRGRIITQSKQTVEAIGDRRYSRSLGEFPADIWVYGARQLISRVGISGNLYR